MNGQTSRLEATRQILYGLDIERIVETGTHRAATTEWFSQFGLPIDTVELDDRFFAFSQARLAKFSNTKIFHDSSVSFLKKAVAANCSLRDAVQLFYLDAHWYDYLPLREELQLIVAHYANCVVMIDDFRVTDDAGYGYDDYGPGKSLDLEYIDNCGLPPLFVFFPATQSTQETGMRRGWVVLTANEAFARKLETIKLLRSFPYKNV